MRPSAYGSRPSHETFRKVPQYHLPCVFPALICKSYLLHYMSSIVNRKWDGSATLPLRNPAALAAELDYRQSSMVNGLVPLRLRLRNSRATRASFQIVPRTSPCASYMSSIVNRKCLGFANLPVASLLNPPVAIKIPLRLRLRIHRAARASFQIVHRTSYLVHVLLHRRFLWDRCACAYGSIFQSTGIFSIAPRRVS